MTCAIVGMVAGAFAGEAIVAYQKRVETAHLADLWVTRANEVSDDAVKALNTLSQADLPLCSDADLALLREQVFASRFLKSASRTRDGMLLCSSILGRLRAPVKLPEADLVTDRGHRIYFNAPVVGAPGMRAMFIAEGTASVSLTRDAYRILADPRLQYVGVGEYAGRVFLFMSSENFKLPITPADLRAETPYFFENHRYEVRCSKMHTGCIVARLNAALPNDSKPVVLGFILFGLLAGFALGYAAELLRMRNRSTGRKLRLALRKNTLEVFYQPIVRLSNRELVGAEALVRWKDTSGKYMDPELFVAVAEAEGFITELSEYVLRKVLLEMRQYWRQHPDFQVSINIAAEDLANPVFPAFVARTLRENGVSTHNVGFEITERSTADKAAVSAGIRALRLAGHSISIDDFGVEYSSLSYLSDLHVNAIKLDRSFCRMVPDDERSRHIAAQIVTLANLLKLDIVIEGIEHEVQAGYFSGFDSAILAQGWLFSKALPADDLMAFGESGKARD